MKVQPFLKSDKFSSVISKKLFKDPPLHRIISKENEEQVSHKKQDDEEEERRQEHNSFNFKTNKSLSKKVSRVSSKKSSYHCKTE